MVYLKVYNYFRTIVEKNINHEFKLENIDETKNYFLQEIKQNDMMSRKHNMVCTKYNSLNYIEHFLVLASAATGCIAIFTFASLLGIAIGVTSFATGLKICAIATGVRKYKSIMKKKEKKHDKIVKATKCSLSDIKVLISKAFIDSIISHDEFILINNVLKEYDDMKEKLRNLKTFFHRRFQSIYKTMLLHCLKGRKNTESRNPKLVKTKTEE